MSAGALLWDEQNFWQMEFLQYHKTKRQPIFYLPLHLEASLFKFVFFKVNFYKKLQFFLIL